MNKKQMILFQSLMIVFFMVMANAIYFHPIGVLVCGIGIGFSANSILHIIASPKYNP